MVCNVSHITSISINFRNGAILVVNPNIEKPKFEVREFFFFSCNKR